MEQRKKGVTLTEVIVVAVLLSILTVAVSNSLIPIVSRTQAEFLTAVLLGDLNNFQVMATRDFRNSSSATLNGNVLTLQTTYVDTPYVLYVFEESEYGGMRVKRVGATNASGTNIQNSIVLIRGRVVTPPSLERDPDTRLNVVTFDMELPTGVQEVSVYAWSRM